MYVYIHMYKRIHYIHTLMGMCICIHSQKYIVASRLRDALSIPEILGAIQHLEMPVSAAWYVQQTFPKLGDEKG